MRYFVNYAQVYGGNNDVNKRERLRLQTYIMAVRFFTKKHDNLNIIFQEFSEMKKYLESKEFTSVYFLSPFVLNENQLVKDMMEVLKSSGETNKFIYFRNLLKEETSLIKKNRSFISSKLIEVTSADEYIEKYLESDSNNLDLILKDEEDYQIVFATAKKGYEQKDMKLSLLYFKLLLKKVTKKEELDQVISLAMGLKENKYSPLLIFLGGCYEHQLYTREDKYDMSYMMYLEAALLNDPDGLYLAGLYNFLGLAVKKDKEKALLYFSKAAALNQVDSFSCIGIYYLAKGDKANAKLWLKKSASKGEFKALLLLDSDFERK